MWESLKREIAPQMTDTEFRNILESGLGERKSDNLYHVFNYRFEGEINSEIAKRTYFYVWAEKSELLPAKVKSVFNEMPVLS